MIRRFALDVFALVLFTVSATAYVHFDHQSSQRLSWYQHLNELEIITPKLINELLDINFDSKQHYDNFSQLLLQLDKVKNQLPQQNTTTEILLEFETLTIRYMELATMLKTSKRLVAYANVSDLKAAQQQQIVQLVYLINQFSNSMQSSVKSQIESQLDLANIVFTEIESGAFSWSHFQQHYRFILDNADLSETLRNQMLALDISSALVSQRDIYNDQNLAAQTYGLLSLFGIVVSFIVIFAAVLLRQRQALKTKSEQYKEAAAVKTRFLANMSHEIRTPMTGIIGLAELTLESKLTSQQKDYLDKLHFSATSLLAIINDILDFTKIESGKMTIEQVRYKHSKLFDNLTVMLGKAFKEKSLELIYDIDIALPDEVMGDPVRTSQILLNLTNNAIKFTEKGHVIVKSKLLEAEPTDRQSAAFIEYQIIDTGIGLSEEQRLKLFNRFEQADESTTRKYGGTGLGLSIVKQLVELQNGTIEVESEQGKGSCFTLRLPYIVADTSETIPPKLPPLNAKNILIIEDNLVTQTVLVKMIHDLNLEFEVADSVAVANQKCQNTQFDIALVDWHLPQQSGLDFIEQADQLTFKPGRFIVCSAFDLDYITSHIKLDIQFEYLAKPLTKWSLHSAIEHGQSKDYKADSSRAQGGSASATETNEHGQLKFNDAKVLLVEDNKVNQTIAASMLTSFGIDFDLAENGRLALEAVERGRFDLILMDIQMPEMDGLEATKRIRQQYSPEQLPIIALTANVTQEEVAHYLEVGMNDHLPKPYDKEAIVKALELHMLK